MQAFSVWEFQVLKFFGRKLFRSLHECSQIVFDGTRTMNHNGCLLSKNLRNFSLFYSTYFIEAIRIILPVYEKYVDNDIDQIKKVTEE